MPAKKKYTEAEIEEHLKEFKRIQKAAKKAKKAKKACFPYTDDGLAAILDKLKFQLSQNIRTKIHQFKNGDDPWTNVSNESDSWLRQRISENCKAWNATKEVPVPWAVSDSLWRQLVESHCFERQHDHIREWMAELPEWDGTPRNPLGLLQIEQTEETAAYVEFATWAPFCHAVRRVRNPGEAVHDFTVLIGAQGSGKSSWFIRSLPEEYRRELCSDRFKFTASEQEQLEKCTGKLFVEVGELEQARKAHIGAIKETISQSSATVRKPYRKNEETYDAHWVLYGTANSDDALPADITGNRRMLPLRLANGKLTNAENEALWTWWNDNREQVWAEAIKRVAENDTPQFVPDKLWETQSFAVSKHTTANDMLDIMSLWLDEHKPKFVTLLGLLQNSGLVDGDRTLGEVSQPVQNQAIDALHKANYKSRARQRNDVTNKVEAGWKPKETDDNKENDDNA